MFFIHGADLVVVGLFAELYDLLVPRLPSQVGAPVRALVLPSGGYFVNLRILVLEK